MISRVILQLTSSKKQDNHSQVNCLPTTFISCALTANEINLKCYNIVKRGMNSLYFCLYADLSF